MGVLSCIRIGYLVFVGLLMVFLPLLVIVSGDVPSFVCSQLSNLYWLSFIGYRCLTLSFFSFNISLSSNRITRDGAKQIAELLKRDTALKILDLGFNRIGDDGAQYIADALGTYNSTLET